MNLLNRLYQIFLSEYTKRRIERTILYVALLSFFIHLLLIYLTRFNIISFLSESALIENPISAI
ncbi:MAG: hypothetical protein KC469_08790, partial [Flavobacteriaceae bacterium]|nr:hypothetical protein [Flavobacteriaceae bacterium]